MSDLNFLNQVRTNCIPSHSAETELLGSSTLTSKSLSIDKNFSQSNNYGLFGLIYISALSPPQRPLCVVGRLGRKKKRAHGARLLLFYRDTYNVACHAG